MTSAVKISRVLVGVDFDDASASALKMAGALASVWDADITVFHAAAVEVPTYFTGAQIVALQAERERSRAAIADRLHALAISTSRAPFAWWWGKAHHKTRFCEWRFHSI
jgi:hypothetical protein